MTIAVGHMLDKYELIEKVGQGGMAVVYRGLDRSLRRPVAIKVLHQHLAEHQEARDRFEREAHAVAKLHHENILEIFAFSGKDSDESYIVTEFIDGQTLEGFIREHRIQYPEIGAMIVAQVCRALGHAHGYGVLHRDVKPENIMIRKDGIVKLMDFGIAQLLDMQRMTVTGQIIGSPAYMAPEQVSGGALDFRTDVFAAGIVLYQLVVGELPFQGKNPHEMLKRIADCTYSDPRKASPLVGNELGRIITRALARDPEDRYADISEMVAALDAYLAGSGLSDHRRELALYFEAPASYEMALRQRLVDHLGRRSRALLASDPVTALELCNRVLTIDPDNREVLGAIRSMSRRRLVRAAVIAGSAALLAGAALGARAALWPRGGADAAPAHAALAVTPERDDRDPRDDRPGLPVAVASEPRVDAAAEADETEADDAPRRPSPRLATPAHRPRLPDRHPSGSDAGIAPSPLPSGRVVKLHVSPRKSEYRIGAGAWQPIDRTATLELPPGAVSLEIRNDACCQATSRVIPADQAGGAIQVTLGYLPASITPVCDRPGARVQIDGRPAELGRRFSIPITGALGRQPVKVTFIGEGTDEQALQLRYNEARDVTCRLD